MEDRDPAVPYPPRTLVARVATIARTIAAIAMVNPAVVEATPVDNLLDPVGPRCIIHGLDPFNYVGVGGMHPTPGGHNSMQMPLHGGHVTRGDFDGYSGMQLHPHGAPVIPGGLPNMSSGDWPMGLTQFGVPGPPLFG
ncbi:hypothetical protein GUJ93_ZPchr0006g41732 [Zizania palustris]|uniref:Uncharacterized protein n=1 Tax=Zizania palustris TaxID=103762 RepID=A0A8J5SXN6_ZIZPA|nr:hypothetical protein GUJ93_ZPchr0006g41732 [Zizania palustris]